MRTARLLGLELSKKMWPKVSAFALLGVISALSAFVFKGRIPDALSDAVGAETAVNILSILASSMLAVTTFSLTTMVSAYSSATSSVSPRATSLITEDKTTRNALAVFLGSFLFGLVGIIALNMGLYEGGGRFILFIFTLIVLAVIVIVFIRWIERLTTLGRVGETSRLVEEAAHKAMALRAQRPTLGCNPLDPGTRPPGTPVHAGDYGYVCYIDIAALSALADKHDWRIYVQTAPGDYLTPEAELCVVDGPLPNKLLTAVRDRFTLRDQREFDQDPRFGLQVLAEIGSRAASEAVRDHGTTMDIIVRLTRVLELYATTAPDPAVLYPRLWFPQLPVALLFEDAFHAIAREAAPLYEVGLRLQHSLTRLARHSDATHEAARRISALCLDYASTPPLLMQERMRLDEEALGGRGTEQLDAARLFASLGTRCHSPGKP